MFGWIKKLLGVREYAENGEVVRLYKRGSIQGEVIEQPPGVITNMKEVKLPNEGGHFIEKQVTVRRADGTTFNVAFDRLRISGHDRGFYLFED
jgi:hypothetical protein